MKPGLQQLNHESAAAEQRRDDEFFAALLSERLLFRRTNGTVVGKAEFLEDLQKPNSFTERIAESIEVSEDPAVPNRALVTLVVRTRRADATTQSFRNVRFFTRAAAGWELESWYNYEITGA